MTKQDAIRFFDMFAGIGGFRAGLECAGGFTCIGRCEIDKPLSVDPDTQAYKQAGNVVTVNVVHALGLRLRAAHAAIVAATGAEKEAT